MTWVRWKRNSCHREPGRMTGRGDPVCCRWIAASLALLAMTIGCAHAPAHSTIDTPPPFPRVHFATNSTRIVTRDQHAIVRNIAWLTQTPTAQILLEGHADVRGRTVKNLELGDRRARAVAAILIAHGIAPGQIVGVISRGEVAPIAPEHNARAWAANRRVEMIVR